MAKRGYRKCEWFDKTVHMKRVSFDEYDDKDIQRIKDKINRRPRKNSISFPLKSTLSKTSSKFVLTA